MANGGLSTSQLQVLEFGSIINTEELNMGETLTEIIEKIQFLGLWKPGDLGLTFQKVGPNEVSLISKYDTVACEKALERMIDFFDSENIVLHTKDVVLRDKYGKRIIAIEDHAMEMDFWLRTAGNIEFPCGTPILESSLKDVEWSKSANGEHGVMITCPHCDENATFVDVRAYSGLIYLKYSPGPL